jgi:hypothetical protein
VLDAAPQVLAALPDMTPESLQSVLSQRGDPALDPRRCGLAGGEGATLAGSRAYRIRSSRTCRRAAQARGGRDPASRKRRRALSCIVVAQRLRRLHGAAKGPSR